jgi:hypothetical protein
VWVWVLFAEGQRSLPHPRRLPEEGRSTASLPNVKIQEEDDHAIRNCCRTGFQHLLPQSLLLKGHKAAAGLPQILRFIKKELIRQALSAPENAEARIKSPHHGHHSSMSRGSL